MTSRFLTRFYIIANVFSLLLLSIKSYKSTPTLLHILNIPTLLTPKHQILPTINPKRYPPTTTCQHHYNQTHQPHKHPTPQLPKSLCRLSTKCTLRKVQLWRMWNSCESYVWERFVYMVCLRLRVYGWIGVVEVVCAVVIGITEIWLLLRLITDIWLLVDEIWW